MQKKVRLIQCGVGGHGKGWVGVTAKSPEFDLVAVADVSPENLAAIADIVPSERHFISLEAALETVEADAVLTVTPPAVHVLHARIAFARGLHLMTEKPIADTIGNAREMVRLASVAGRQLVVSQNYRFHPPMQKVRALIEQNAVGELGHGHVDFYIPADFTGTFRETMEYPLLVDMAIHHLDLIRFVTGQNIVKVTAQSFRPAWSWYKHEPGLKMLLELENGVAFSYSGDWSARGRKTTWNGSWRLQCADGSLHLENDEITLARSERWGKNQVEEKVGVPVPERGELAATLHHFADAIHSGDAGELSGASNLWSFAAVVAGVQSAQTGLSVAVADAIGSGG